MPSEFVGGLRLCPSAPFGLKQWKLPPSRVTGKFTNKTHSAARREGRTLPQRRKGLQVPQSVTHSCGAARSTEAHPDRPGSVSGSNPANTACKHRRSGVHFTRGAAHLALTSLCHEKCFLRVCVLLTPPVPRWPLPRVYLPNTEVGQGMEVSSWRRHRHQRAANFGEPVTAALIRSCTTCLTQRSFLLAAATHLGRIGGRRRGPNGIVWRRCAAAHGGRSAAAPARAHAWLVAVRTGYRKLLVFIRAPGKTERGKQESARGLRRAAAASGTSCGLRVLPNSPGGVESAGTADRGRGTTLSPLGRRSAGVRLGSVGTFGCSRRRGD